MSKASWKSKIPGAFKVPLDVEMPAFWEGSGDDYALGLYVVTENGVRYLCACLHRFFKGGTIFVNDRGDADLGPGALNQHGKATWEQL